ncbi:EAL domain-containing response regulator [Sulfurimonas sp.]
MMSEKYWEILVVDDDVAVHNVIKKELKNIFIQNKPVKILHAHNAQEAKELLKNNADTAIAFIDISMETPDAGLKLVEHIRHVLYNTSIRIIMIDSGNTPIPTDEIFDHYDINGYKEKEEIVSGKFYLIIRNALKQYEQYKELKANRDEIYTKMTTNEVTGLPNRMKLSESLDTIGEKSLILINIDDFSLINEHNGFDFGNEVLRSFAKFLVKKYAKYAQIFHLHSDNFALLCIQLDGESTEENILRIKDDIAKYTFSVNTIKIRLTASIGIALDERGNIIQKAEFALKEARRYGKNSIKKYTDDLNILRTIHTNSLWSTRVRDALQHKKMHAYFQPIKELKTNTIVKYETLIRLEYNNEIYSPFHFLDAALYSGQIFKIFQFVLEEACKKAVHRPYLFTVNVSQYDMQYPDFLSTVKKIVKKYNLPPSRITFEILENDSIAHNKNIQALLNELHTEGFQLAIDDFGAQCSNFGQLNNLPVDFIKIDGTYIKNIVTDENSQIVTITIVEFAHKKGIPVIAEYVCSKEIYEYVKNMGIDYAQGYEISEPKPELS